MRFTSICVVVTLSVLLGVSTASGYKKIKWEYVAPAINPTGEADTLAVLLFQGLLSSDAEDAFLYGLLNMPEKHFNLKNGTHLRLFPGAIPITVIERNRIQAVMQEQHLGQTELIDGATAVTVGKLLGCDGLVIGRVICDGRSTTIKEERQDDNNYKYTVNCTENKTTVRVEGRVVSTRTGEILSTFSEMRVGSSKGCPDGKVVTPLSELNEQAVRSAAESELGSGGV